VVDTVVTSRIININRKVDFVSVSKMDSLPLELFGLITAYCSAELLLKLEYVCKSWKENLGEQWIWKVI
jgi:hypothetical protein